MEILNEIPLEIQNLLEIVNKSMVRKFLRIAVNYKPLRGTPIFKSDVTAMCYRRVSWFGPYSWNHVSDWKCLYAHEWDAF